jgi:hypothetical protein
MLLACLSREVVSPFVDVDGVPKVSHTSYRRPHTCYSRIALLFYQVLAAKVNLVKCLLRKSIIFLIRNGNDENEHNLSTGKAKCWSLLIAPFHVGRSY